MQGALQDLPLNLVDEPIAASREKIDAEKIGTLADDISVNGLLQPVGVRGPNDAGRYEIVWGHRRLLAIRSLRWSHITAKVYTPDYDPDVARIAENLQREELTPIEEGRECAKFISKGHTRGQVARLFRRSAAWVDGRLDLLALPDDVQTALQDSKISAGVARVLGQVEHEGYRRSLIREAINVGASVNVAEVWLAHFRQDGQRLAANLTTIEQLAGERENFKIKIECQGCHDETDYDKTQQMRLCVECWNTIARIFAAIADGSVVIPA